MKVKITIEMKFNRKILMIAKLINNKIFRIILNKYRILLIKIRIKLKWIIVT